MADAEIWPRATYVVGGMLGLEKGLVMIYLLADLNVP